MVEFRIGGLRQSASVLSGMACVSMREASEATTKMKRW